MKFCVIGLGRFGDQLARSLAEQGAEVLAIDSNEQIVESIKDHVTQAICVRIRDEESLLAVGVNDMDTVIVATGEDFAQSVLITALLKNHLKMPYVIARAINNIHEEILKLVGANKVILPERDMGVKLADKLSTPLVDLINITELFAITQIKAPHSFVGKTVAEAFKAKQRRVACVAVKKGESVILVSPEYVILENDTLVCAGERKYLTALAHLS
jgi:trk system potassium uptake protein TrkA